MNILLNARVAAADDVVARTRRPAAAIGRGAVRSLSWFWVSPPAKGAACSISVDSSHLTEFGFGMFRNLQSCQIDKPLSPLLKRTIVMTFQP